MTINLISNDEIVLKKEITKNPIIRILSEYILKIYFSTTINVIKM
jgi:hypothetical protein